MKKILIFLFLTHCLLFAKAESTMQSVFAEANEAYKKGEYSQAATLYEGILSKNQESATLYYNLGNAYFRQNNFAKAILNYERSLRISPNNGSAQMNLKIANTKVIDKIDNMPNLFFVNWWKGIVTLFSNNTWAVLSIIFACLFCSAVVYFLFNKNYKQRKFSFYGGLGIFVLFLISFFSANSQYQNRFSKNEAIVMEAIANIKSSPDNNSVDKFILHEGSKVSIQDELNDWVKIKIANGESGWINKNFIEII